MMIRLEDLMDKFTSVNDSNFQEELVVEMQHLIQEANDFLNTCSN